MKLSTLLGTVACLTAFSLPCLAQGQPEFDTSLNGNENAEIMPAAPSEDGDFEMAMAPDVGIEPAAFPLSATAIGGGRFKFSEEQLEKIYNLKNKLADESGPVSTELKKQKRHLKDLLTQTSLDRAAVTTTQDKINKLNAELGNARIAFKMDLLEQFTPEQKKSLRYKGLKRSRMGGMKHGAPGHMGRKHH